MSRPRCATTPANPSNSVSAIIAHWVSVGMAAVVAAPTSNAALEAAALLPAPVTNAPIGSVLTKVPAIPAVTFTVIVQTPGMPLAAAGIVPPVMVITEPPTGATSAPPQVLLALDGVAIANPLGKLSVKVVIAAAPAFALLNEIVLVEAPPAAILAGPKTAVAPTPPEGTPEHAVALMVLSSNVTAALRAKALPDMMFAP